MRKCFIHFKAVREFQLSNEKVKPQNYPYRSEGRTAEVKLKSLFQFGRTVCDMIHLAHWKGEGKPENQLENGKRAKEKRTTQSRCWASKRGHLASIPLPRCHTSVTVLYKADGQSNPLERNSEYDGEARTTGRVKSELSQQKKPTDLMTQAKGNQNGHWLWRNHVFQVTVDINLNLNLTRGWSFSSAQHFAPSRTFRPMHVPAFNLAGGFDLLLIFLVLSTSVFGVVLHHRRRGVATDRISWIAWSLGTTMEHFMVEDIRVSFRLSELSWPPHFSRVVVWLPSRRSNFASYPLPKSRSYLVYYLELLSPHSLLPCAFHSVTSDVLLTSGCLHRLNSEHFHCSW